MARKTTDTPFIVASIAIIFCAMFVNVQGAPAKTSVGYSNLMPSYQDMYKWLWATSLQLSKIVGETQAEFAQHRLGDKYYDNYVHKIPGIPGPIWNLDRLSEQTLLKMEVEQLFLFADFLKAIQVHEAQQGDQFAAKFQRIVDEIHFLITYVQSVELNRGYPITHQKSSPQPTLKPTSNQKEQDEWKLGVLKALLYWLIPVQGEFNQRSMTV